MINAENTSPFEPVQTIVVYRKYHNYYIESHDIIKSSAGYSWAEGKPFQKEQLSELALSLGNQTFAPLEVKGLLPENILYLHQTFTETNLVWWLPPAKRNLYFKSDLRLENTAYNLPGLIFVVNNRGLDVYAVKGIKKPTLKTKLYKAPFHNTSSSGDVCLGTAGETKKKKTLQEEIARWEKRFFNSRFTHGGDNVAKGFNINLVLKAAIKTKFNEAALSISPFKNLQSVLNRLKK